MESLEALTRSLERMLAREEGEGKSDVSSLSKTPPRFLDKAVATLGISLIALGEEIGEKMAGRILQQILHTADPSAKRMVPLALAMLHLSNPQAECIETLDRFSRFQTTGMSANALLAAGLAGAGSLDGRLSRILKNLTGYYETGPAVCTDALILTQGLVNLGKGLMTISPFQCDRQLILPTSLAASLIVAFCCLDVKHTLLGRLHHLIYLLVPAIKPRFVVTLDEKSLKPIEAAIKVGKPVDLVGQVGKPRLVTANSIQNSPILLGPQDKAELSTESYTPLSKIIEGVVLLRSD